jgi:hypothetical protein
MLKFSLNKVDWRRVAGAGAAAVIIVMALYLRLQHIELERARLVYERPRTESRVKIVRKEGPVRIKERIIRTEGREEIVREEVREPVLEVRDVVSISEPVFAPARNQNRWLVGGGMVDFRPGYRQAWAAFGGYSFGNRIDLCAGVSGRGRPSVLVMLRF